VLIASNRGLCGAFNSNICKFAVQHIETNYKEQLKQGNVKFLTIGKKSHDYVIRNHYNELCNNDAILDDLTFVNTTAIAEFLMSEFLNKNCDKVEIIYNSFKNAAIYYQIAEQFLPVNLKTTGTTAPKEYILEPDVETIVEKMLPKSMKVQLHKIILDSFVAEQGARMTAMHQATDNATELIKELTLMYNKARQAAITNEIIEITSGAEALK
jgi:F-type H+-transporting ATPase subunit gamma